MTQQDNSNKNLEALLSQSNPPLRQRRQRTSFTDDALLALDEKFKVNPYPDINEREAMAHEFKTTEDRIQVWFQNKRARFRKRMHKENDKTTKTEKKTKKSTTKNEELYKSPIRTTDHLIQTNAISTPVSSILSAKPNFSFGNYSSPQISNDSAYYSPNISTLSMDLNKSLVNNYSFNSPLNLQSPNVQFFNSYNLSPYQYYYNPYVRQSTNQFQFNNNQSTYTPITTQSTQVNRTERMAKSVFRPYE